ncbi:unnamed protein product [Cylicocyclus nassatus]|uniref:Uncharacterized protein n=1 Tax=Cylicocyclus nassatus TaxID=53992 RepID=A0AA36MB03_CYLNA|nr:unnamed protein product [Cylicocyclus nassatus]
MEPIEAQAGDSQAKAYQPHAQDRSSEERDTLQEDVEMLQGRGANKDSGLDRGPKSTGGNWSRTTTEHPSPIKRCVYQ